MTKKTVKIALIALLLILILAHLGVQIRLCFIENRILAAKQKAMRDGQTHVNQIETQIPAKKWTPALSRCISILSSIAARDDGAVPNEIKYKWYFLDRLLIYDPEHCGPTGNALLVTRAYEGKFSPENVTCRDAVAYLAQELGPTYGYYCMCNTTHVSYMVKIRIHKSACKYLIISYNDYSLTWSRDNEPLWDFLRRTQVRQSTVMDREEFLK